MNTRDILTLFDYNYWANRRIIAAGAQTGREQFLTPTTHSFGSLQRTLVRLLDGEHGCSHSEWDFTEFMNEQH
jgi:uncharacterized damage-inducible protein DinB